jgi:hypothetical protein
VVSALDLSRLLLWTHVLMTEMLEELQLSIGSFGQDRGREWLHDFLDGNGLLGQLIFGGASLC